MRIALVEEDMDMHRRNGMPAIAGRQRGDPEFNEDKALALRVEVADLALAEAAGSDPEVQRFRADLHRIWGNHDGRDGLPINRKRLQVLLAPEAALRFVRSPALALLTEADFAHIGVPLSRHETVSVEESRYPPGTVPELVVTVRVADDRRTTIVLPPPGALAFEKVPVTMPAPGAETVQVRARPGTPLHRLAETAVHLAERSPWDEAAAALVILTGVPPHRPPLQVTVREGEVGVGADARRWAQVCLDVHPFGDGAAVADAFVAGRRRAGFEPPRSADLRTLAVAAFVRRHALLHPRTTWPEKMDAWNDAVQEEWRFSSYRQFRKVALRGEANAAPPRTGQSDTDPPPHPTERSQS